MKCCRNETKILCFFAQKMGIDMDGREKEGKRKNNCNHNGKTNWLARPNTLAASFAAYLSCDCMSSARLIYFLVKTVYFHGK